MGFRISLSLQHRHRRVFLGNGNGTFQPVMNFPTADNSSTIAIGYFNRDAFQDVAVVGNGGISVLLGNGDGTFQAPLFFDTGFPISFGARRDRSPWVISTATARKTSWRAILLPPPLRCYWETEMGRSAHH